MIPIIILHNKIFKKIELYSKLVEINLIELNKIKNKLPKYYSGKEFIDSNHNYSVDLNIFGKNSIYNYICRCNTYHGKTILSNWFEKKSKKNHILERQKAVKELSKMVDFRQTLQAIGLSLKNYAFNPHKIIDWSNSKNNFKYHKYLILIIILLLLFNLGLIYLFFINLKLRFLIFLFITNGFIIYITEEKINNTFMNTSNSVKSLKIFSNLLKHIENEEFTSNHLNKLKTQLYIEGNSPSNIIKKMSFYVEWLDLRKNIIHFPINLITLYDLFFILRLEQINISLSGKIEKWFKIIGEFEALSSLSIIHFENPEYFFPIIEDGNNFFFEAQNMGHILIDKKHRISNDIKLENGNIILITGSNMAGKSTFLKTIGTTMILAYTGAPVPSSYCRLSIVDLYTSMSSRDSLENGVSSFYAELKKIKTIIGAINNKKNIFIILDEILKGTNSSDRTKGSIALIEQFIKNKTTAIISTHDLSLGELGKKYKNNVKNYSFNGLVEGEKLSFDYKLHRGICTRMNAIQLMKNMGIELD